MDLYKWQKECLGEWIENDTTGIVHVVTGAGKTILALGCCEHLFSVLQKPVQVRVIVPTIALARQWKKDILAFIPSVSETDVGLFYGSVKCDPAKPFVIYVVNSARYTVSRHIIQNMKNDIHQFLICDECHRYTGDSNSLIFAFRRQKDFRKNLYHCLGLSATPYTAKFEQILVPALGKEIFCYDLSEAYEDKTISPLSIIHVQVPLSGEERKNYGILDRKIQKTYSALLTEYPDLKYMSVQKLFDFLSHSSAKDPDSLEAIYCSLIRQRRNMITLASFRHDCTVRILELKNPQEKAIVFCERIPQAEKLFRDLKEIFPGKVGHYHSDMEPEMKSYYLEQFRTGENTILVTCKALDEGLNVPDAVIGIVVSSSSNNRQRIQRLGRILRKSADKNQAVLYYLHISNTVEKDNYIESSSDSIRTAEMSYDPAHREFFCDEYERCALQFMKDSGIQGKEKEEFLFCIQTGYGRGDWLLSYNLLQKHIEKSTGRREKNYWIVMSKLKQYSKTG